MFILQVFTLNQLRRIRYMKLTQIGVKDLPQILKNTRMQLNIGDAAYILDTFLDLCPEAIEFFNKFIEYRGMEIVSCECDELARK